MSRYWYYTFTEKNNWNLFDIRSDPDLERENRSGSADPNPHQNEADPKLCLNLSQLTIYIIYLCLSIKDTYNDDDLVTIYSSI